MSDQTESVTKQVSNLRTAVGVLCGLVLGGFAAGTYTAKWFNQGKSAYATVIALQQNKWGADASRPPGDRNAEISCPPGSYVTGAKLLTGPPPALELACKFLNTKLPD